MFEIFKSSICFPFSTGPQTPEQNVCVGKHDQSLIFVTGQFLIQKVVPQASGESSKVKVKVRVNIHGIFSVSSASLVEVQKSDETEEPMETEQANDKEGEVLQPNKCLLFLIQCLLYRASYWYV